MTPVSPDRRSSETAPRETEHLFGRAGDGPHGIPRLSPSGGVLPLLLSGGMAIWVALAILSFAGLIRPRLIEMLALLGPLIVVPLGIGLVSGADPQGAAALPGRLATRFLPLAAAALVVSFLLEPGPAAGALAGIWLLFTALCGLWGLRLVFVHRLSLLSTMENLCLVAALGYVSFGAAWFLLSRLGARPMGFLEPIVLLTGVHFHFAAFAAPLLASETGRAIALQALDPRKHPGDALLHRVWERRHVHRSHRLFQIVAAGVVAGPAILAAGWAASSPSLKLVAAIVLAVSHLGLALLTLSILRVRARSARVFLAASALAQILAMILVLVYATGEFRELPALSIPEMARTHGLLNGLGFTMLGLLGWTLDGVRRRSPGDCTAGIATRGVEAREEEEKRP